MFFFLLYTKPTYQFHLTIPTKDLSLKNQTLMKKYYKTIDKKK